MLILYLVILPLFILFGMSIVTSDMKIENKLLIVPLIMGGLPAAGFIYLSKLTLHYKSDIL
jgi:hypothetical protein